MIFENFLFTEISVIWGAGFILTMWLYGSVIGFNSDIRGWGNMFALYFIWPIIFIITVAILIATTFDKIKERFAK